MKPTDTRVFAVIERDLGDEQEIAVIDFYKFPHWLAEQHYIDKTQSLVPICITDAKRLDTLILKADDSDMFEFVDKEEWPDLEDELDWAPLGEHYLFQRDPDSPTGWRRKTWNEMT
jgi:hypothetical protein